MSDDTNQGLFGSMFGFPSVDQVQHALRQQRDAQDLQMAQAFANAPRGRGSVLGTTLGARRLARSIRGDDEDPRVSLARDINGAIDEAIAHIGMGDEESTEEDRALAVLDRAGRELMSSGRTSAAAAVFERRNAMRQQIRARESELANEGAQTQERLANVELRLSQAVNEAIDAGNMQEAYAMVQEIENPDERRMAQMALAIRAFPQYKSLMDEFMSRIFADAFGQGGDPRTAAVPEGDSPAVGDDVNTALGRLRPNGN